MILKGPVKLGRNVALVATDSTSSDYSAGRDRVAARPVADLHATAGLANTAALLDPEAVPVKADVAPLTMQTVCEWLREQDQTAQRVVVAAVAAHELDVVAEEARLRGYEQGLKKGSEDAATEWNRALGLLAAAAAAVEDAAESAAARLESQCAEVVVAAFAKIAGTALVTDDAAVGAVREALRTIKSDQRIVIRVCQSDLDRLQPVQQALAAQAGARSLRITADDAVVAGGCIVDTEMGSLDARLDLQIMEVINALRAAKSPGANR